MNEFLKLWTRLPQAKGRFDAEVFVLGTRDEEKSFWAERAAQFPRWNVQECKKSNGHVLRLYHSKRAVFLVRAYHHDEKSKGGHREILQASDYAYSRDSLGSWVSHVFSSDWKQVVIRLMGLNEEQLLGALVGLNIGAYQFKRGLMGQFTPETRLKIFADGRTLTPKDLLAAEILAQAVNLARHMTNLPPNEMHPSVFAEMVRSIFSKNKSVQVSVWQGERLKKERMHLLEAVGRASDFHPCFVHLKYAPPGAKDKPIAFVGKGITFDSGGLNKKTDSGMRLMKKDMGGAACLLGLAWWAVQSKLAIPCDFYFSLAENALGSRAFRPSDIIESRSGKCIEIHNTDAEGRLVLADGLDVAVKQKRKPQLVVDVATLTGAIKVSLGSSIAGLFGNDDQLLLAMERAGSKAGDYLWGMPLVDRYRSQLKSNCADLVNASDGFGGAITAALFLENFVDNVPWLHLDIYGWVDSPEGAWTESGGSGQGVQAMIKFLQEQA